MTIFLVKADNLPYFAKGFEHTIITLEPSDLELLKQNLAYDIEDCENEGITKGHKERAEQGKALLKKLEGV